MLYVLRGKKSIFYNQILSTLYESLRNEPFLYRASRLNETRFGPGQEKTRGNILNILYTLMHHSTDIKSRI